MLHSSIYDLPTIVTFAILFVAMVIFMKFGMVMAAKKMRTKPGSVEGVINEIDGWMLGLLALLMGFTFNMASIRYDVRRDVLIEEANAISNVILRTDLYPDSIRQLMRRDLKEYVEVRIEYYDSYGDREKILTTLSKTNAVFIRLWKRATEHAAKENSLFVVSNQMVPALNHLHETVTTRDIARNAHVPVFILNLLVLLCICSSFLAGYRLKNSIDWLSVASLCLMVSISFYMILDLDSPSGSINLDEPHQKIIELRQMFDQ